MNFQEPSIVEEKPQAQVDIAPKELPPIEEDYKVDWRAGDKQMRVDVVMFDQIKEIKDELKELVGIKISDRAITALIGRNGYFEKIKKEIIEFVTDGGKY